jgi:hypothetical protein
MSAAHSIATGGLVAGALDISAAFAIYGPRGASPVRILQSVASGALGPAAFEGGVATAVLGGVLHFFIAFVAAAVYYGLSQKSSFLARRPFMSGTLYGVAVYIVMNHIVVPLSAIGTRPIVVRMALLLVGVHIFCVGIPIALAVRRYGTNDPR